MSYALRGLQRACLLATLMVFACSPSDPTASSEDRGSGAAGGGGARAGRWAPVDAGQGAAGNAGANAESADGGSDTDAGGSAPLPPQAGRSGSGGTAGGTGGAQGSAMLCAPDGNCEEGLAPGPAAHIEGDIDYPDKPPVGGPHNNCWAKWGVHDQAVPDDNWVHNLEHGGVVLLYNCPEGCTDEVEQLKSFVAAHPRTLLTPYPDLSHRFAVVAWGYRLQLDTLDLATLEAFYTLRFDHAPESISSEPLGCP